MLVPGPHIDKPPVRVAGRVSYDELVDCGVEVYEYQPTMLHAKSMVVDGAWSSVGSVNFDNRSFQLHDEATLCVLSEAFAGRADRAVRARPRAVRADRARALEAAAGRSSGRASPRSSSHGASCRRYGRTRIPAAGSYARLLENLRSGASGSSPTLTPCFQLGGQIAMKRA